MSHIDAVSPAASPLKVFAIPLKESRKYLGNKAISQIYEAIGLGKLDAVKDGKKLLITVESIERYNAALPRATIKPPPVSRSHKRKHEKKKQKRA
jgi:hypothetical protein